MPVPLNLVKEAIEKALPGSKVDVIDLVGDGDHLQATVIAPQFEGLGLLKQHQLVFAPLKETLKADLHALALKTYSPSQWEKSGKK